MDGLSGNLCWLLDRASHGLTTELTAALEEVGIPPRAHPVLVAAMEGEYSQIELARRVGLDKTTMVATIDELEAAGLVERRPSPTDRRARLIAVTPTGRRKARRVDAIFARIRDDVLGALPEGDRDVFMRSLALLVSERLSEPVAGARPVRRRAVRA
ncbi:MAG: MarR family winged helix-turn-helix transcriptional regulator [Thermoleophilia bacterium]